MSTRKLSLSLAVVEYEHVRDVANGAVLAQGIELTVTYRPTEDLPYLTHNPCGVGWLPVIKASGSSVD